MRARFLAAGASVITMVALAGIAYPASGLRPSAAHVPAGLGLVPADAGCRLPAGLAPAPAERVRVLRGVPYADGQRLDVYLPANGRVDRPMVLAVHGGGWHTGSRRGMADTAGRLARAGFVVAAPGYSLAGPGRATYPRPLLQLQAAVRFLREHAVDYGADPRRVGVLGSSAGGHLGMLLADAAVGSCAAGDRVAAVVTWSAPLDLPRLVACNRADRCSLARQAADFLGCSVTACPERWAAASPVRAASRDDPPALMFTSTDELVPAGQAAAMAAALRAAGVPEWVVPLPGHRHASAYADDALGPTVAFFTRVLTGR